MAGLTLTAESENALATEIYQQSIGDISTTYINSKVSGISKYINLLADAIGKENTYFEDKFQARVCLGSIYWCQGESFSAISTLPSNIKEEFDQLENHGIESPNWSRLCVLKASYIKSIIKQRENSVTEALNIFQSALPILSSTISSSGHGKESRLWTELFLTEFCTLSCHALKLCFSFELLTFALSALRFWAKFWATHELIPLGGRAILADVTRRHVWRGYYIMLSDMVMYEFPFFTALSIAYPEVSTKKSQFCAELKRVEAQYESLLMSEVPFPKADDASTEVEEFVEHVVQNWRVLCGTNFKEKDLGEGGTEAISRNVLDILYRAAKKSFHSTSILRHLFTLNCAVAEFELAFKAFDTYMILIKKGKAQMEKTGELKEGFDNDDTILIIASEYIKALSRYGFHRWSKKAYETSRFFEEWLETNQPSFNGKDHSVPNNSNSIPQSSISPQTFALAWRCIGIGYAQWARLTFDAASRSDIQSKAIRCLRNSLLPQYESPRSPETLFALGVLLAETRQLDAAINAVKSGLLSTASNDPLSGIMYGAKRFAKERLTIPLWNLLALMLTARQEFISAVKSCEGAFEQFESSQNLFTSEDSNETEKISDEDSSFIDEMDAFEKENLLEVKMTRLTLIELLEGPDVAVNASDDLLKLYSRIFGDIRTDTSPNGTMKSSIPPKSSTGKNVKGGLFSCSNRNQYTSTSTDDQSKSNNAPTIHVTGDDEIVKRHRSLTSVRPSSYGKQRVSSVALPRRSDSVHPHNNEGSRGRMRSQSGGNTLRRSVTLTKKKVNKQQARASSQTSGEKDKKKEPITAQESNRSRAQKLYFSAKPAIHFSRDQQKAHNRAVLVKVWLLIGGFYRRASMREDALVAIDEARQLVNCIETDFSANSIAVLSDNQFSWGDRKTVAELWSDVYTELGYIAVAEGSPHCAAQHFENALTHFSDHPGAIVGLSNILMDVYTGKLSLPPSVPPLILPTPIAPSSSFNCKATNPVLQSLQSFTIDVSIKSTNFLDPVTTKSNILSKKNSNVIVSNPNSIPSFELHCKDQSTASLDRLAARDRAFGLLSSITKSGKGWNNSEAWYSLARAYEESGQMEKAKEILWWCVELEESRGVRDWEVVSNSGYVL